MKSVLVIDKAIHDWRPVFDEVGQSEVKEAIQVFQAEPRAITLAATSRSGAVVEIPSTDEKIVPDVVLFRRVDKKLLFGLQFTCTPCVNCLESIYANLERPWVYGGLYGIKQRLGAAAFPLIEQQYYTDAGNVARAPDPPFVMKVGAAHAGFGKMRIESRQQLDDFTSLMAMYPDYITAEPFVKAESDVRIQKIGPHYRAFKRKIVASWKANVFGTEPEDIPVTSTYKSWADECAKLFGGMDILALDVLHTATGEDVIIELNDCQIGFVKRHEREDMADVARVVVERLSAAGDARGG
ncbi:MAG: hypothetical protein JW839_18070 [Candidatus Lokiarchaeota archaeon]|nr:hypothetical protein [Candidatus Lokiarchaeota archaeon]